MNDLVSRLRALDTARCRMPWTSTACPAPSAGCGRWPRSGRRPAGPSPYCSACPPVPVPVPAPSPGAPKRHLSTAAVDASGPGDVIVVAHQGRTDCAGWGGLLSRAAVIRGIDGVVVDGAARDLAEAEAVGLPVYASGSTSVTARGRAVEVCWGEPVEFAGVPVAPGDLVLADAGGVVIIPSAHAEAVLATAERIAATEAAMAAALDAGRPVSEVMGATYEELTDEQR